MVHKPKTGKQGGKRQATGHHAFGGARLLAISQQKDSGIILPNAIPEKKDGLALPVVIQKKVRKRCTFMSLLGI